MILILLYPCGIYYVASVNNLHILINAEEIIVYNVICVSSFSLDALELFWVLSSSTVGSSSTDSSMIGRGASSSNSVLISFSSDCFDFSRFFAKSSPVYSTPLMQIVSVIGLVIFKGSKINTKKLRIYKQILKSSKLKHLLLNLPPSKSSLSPEKFGEFSVLFEDVSILVTGVLVC